MTRFRLAAFSIFLLLLAPTTMLAAKADPDRFEINHDIHIQPGGQVGDVTCINCSIYVLGRVDGDVTTVNGNIVAQTGASIAGDVTAIRGNARLETGTQVAGDMTVIAGIVRRDPQATVGGDVTAMADGGWIFLLLLLPFVFLGGLIALITWLIQRGRHRQTIDGYTLQSN